MTGEVVRRRAVRVGPVARHDAEVAVLDTGMEEHAVAAVSEARVERGDDRVALLVGGMTGREVDHDRLVVGGERDEVAAVRDLVRFEIDAHRRGLDRRAARVVAGGIEAEDRHVADVAAGRQPRRDDRGPADLGALGQRGQAGHARRLEGSPVAELGQRDVGATVGYEHDVLHRAHHTGAPPTHPKERAAGAHRRVP